MEKQWSNSMFVELQGNTLRSDTTLKYIERKTVCASLLFIDLFSSSLVDFYVCLFTQSMRIFSTGGDPIGPRFSLGKNSSSKLFLIRTIILREELGRFEPILHCPDWGRYSAIHIHIPQCDMVNQLSRIWMEKWWEIRLLETIIVSEIVSQINPSTYDLLQLETKAIRRFPKISQ